MKGRLSEDFLSRGTFEGFYIDWLRRWARRQPRVVAEQSAELLTAEIIGALVGQLQTISLRTLMFEMQLCDQSGLLSGDTPEEKYQRFQENFLKGAYWEELTQAYPAMISAMEACATGFVHNFTELYRRFVMDREDINRLFFQGKPCEKICEVSGSGSDRHNGGQQVYLLRLDNGCTLVYKPRSLAVENRYRDFLFWTAEGVGMPYRWYRVLERDGYGWCEWIGDAPCTSMEELERYYFRNGILLCISYLLGSGDLHYENLIAHGEYPIIIDLEMGIGKWRRDQGETESAETARIYQESVLHTGLLPLSVWRQNGKGINVSALDGRGGQLVPIKMPVIANPGRVDMHIEYRQPVTKEAKNLALLNGEFVEPYRFRKQIQEGFAQTYRFFVKNRQEVSIRLEQFGNAPVRHLFRDTQAYQMIQMASYHPALLVENGKRRSFLGQIRKEEECLENPCTRWQIEQEVKALYQGDVPYFWYRAGWRALFGADGAVWPDFFREPVMNEIRERLCRMNEGDLNRQIKLIHSALLLGTKRIGGGQRLSDSAIAGEQGSKSLCENEGTDSDMAQQGVLAADRIGEILTEQAIWSDDRTDAGWICMSFAGYQEQGFFIRPMSMQLYDGLAGVAVFMQALAAKVKNQEYHRIYETVKNRLFAYTDHGCTKGKTKRKLTGGYTGESSVAYAYQLLYQETGETVFLSYMEKQCRIAAGYLKEDQVFDLLGGNAGAVMVFLNGYQLTGDSKYLNWAKQAGDCLLEQSTSFEWGLGWNNRISGAALTGMAHGVSGIMLALARLGYVTGEERYQEAAYQALCYEDHYYEPEKDDWKDLRFPEQEAADTEHPAWCHGWGGIYMARIQCRRYAQGKFKKALEQKALHLDREFGYGGGGHCLCHGKGGSIGILWQMRREKEARQWKQRLIREMTRGDKEIHQLLELQECENYGFMGGLSGIGYSCLCEEEKIRKISLLLV